MKEIIIAVFQDLFVIFVEISNYFYRSLQSWISLFYILVGMFLLGLYIFILTKNSWRSIIVATIMCFFIVSTIIFSVFIGFQKNNLDNIGVKVVEEIKLYRDRNQNIPISLDNLDSNYFTKEEIKKIKENFEYSYYNKDSVRVKYNISAPEDYFDLAFCYRFSKFKINYIYNKRNNKFVILE